MNESIHYIQYQSSPQTFHLKNNKFINHYFWYYQKEFDITSQIYKNNTSYHSQFIFYPTILGKINLYCQTTYKNGKDKIYTFKIHVLPKTTLYHITQNPSLIKNNEKIIVYKYDKVKLKVEGASSYIWKPIISSDVDHLPSSCYPTFYSDTIDFIPQRDLSYEVIGTDGDQTNSIFINIILKDKPMDVIDIQILPHILFEDVIHKREKKIIKLLKNNKTLLNQLTEFYNITLMSAHNTEFQSKNGRGYRIPWKTQYQFIEDTQNILLSFEQQYQFLRYLLNNTNPHGKSYFMYLINIIQYNFVLPSPSVYGFNIRRERYGP